MCYISANSVSIEYYLEISWEKIKVPAFFWKKTRSEFVKRREKLMALELKILKNHIHWWLSEIVRFKWHCQIGLLTFGQCQKKNSIITTQEVTKRLKMGTQPVPETCSKN